MSLSVYRLKVVDDRQLDSIGRLEATWLANHVACDHLQPDGSTSIVHLTEDEVPLAIESAEECAGDCEFFESNHGTPEDHRQITEQMKTLLPKILESAKQDGTHNNGYVDLEVRW